MKPAIVVAALLGCFLLSIGARAQIGKVEFRSSNSDSVKVVDILNSDTYRYFQIDSVSSSTTLVGHVAIRQEKTLIYCDSLIMYPHQNYIDCFKNVHINDNDSVNIYSNFMRDQVDKKLVLFVDSVKLTDGKGVLTTKELHYDLAQKVGTYVNGGKIVNKESVLTSQEGVYYENTKDIHFRNNVVLRDPQYDLSADSLLYNTQTQISTFITETLIQFKDSSKRTVRTRDGFYDLANKKAQFGKRPVMTEGSQKLTGDSVRMDDSTGLATAIGNAIYTDTAQGIKLLANYMINDKRKNTFLATQRPLMIIKQDKDSLYVTADTLMSARLIDFEAQQKRLAHEDSLHRIYVDSLEKMQADSLHNVALEKAARDSIAVANAPAGDTTVNMQVRDLSDSLAPGQADSLGKIGLDSLHRLQADTTGKPGGKFDSTAGNKHHGPTDTTAAGRARWAADSAKAARPPTERELKRQQRAKEKAARQAIKDSIADIKDHIRARADSVKARQKAIKDSLIIRQQDIADSIADVRSKERARKRFIIDSTRQAAVNDSLKIVAHADSIRHAGFIDSLERVGLTDSANAIRRQDSLKLAARIRRPPQKDTTEAPLPGHEADSVGRIPTKDTTLRFVIGFHHVRIFSDSLQAVGDSLFYSAKDSIFRLFYNPVAWGSDNYQITGDTMYVYTKNKKANRLYVFENALAINRVGRQFYNQLKGTTINVFFKGGEIDYIRAKGNSESIYYVTDEKKAYTGVNKAHADVIDMLFVPKYDSAGKPNGKELNRVVLRSDAEGTMYPFKHVVFEDMILRGFKWQEARRPKSKKELYEEVKRKQEEDFDEDLNPTAPAATPPSKPAAPPPSAPTSAPASAKPASAKPAASQSPPKN